MKISNIQRCAMIALAITTEAAADTPSKTEAPSGPESVVVSATRVEQSSFDLPVAIDSVGQAQLRDGQLQVNLSETLDRIPGLVVQNRQNYAQDLQISARGFGARSTFGIRGMKIYVDGIPATQPDGQGQVSNIDIGSAERIEVLRGPFSALYGNAAGGVISVLTENGKPGTHIDAGLEYGSFGFTRESAKISGDQDDLNYVADAADFRTGGDRSHSAATRKNFNSKLRYTLDDESDLTFIANAVKVSAQDPLGLTRAQFDVDPTQAGTNAVAFNTRKTVDQEQVGIAYHRDLSDTDTIQALIYGGNRAVTQFQAIPTSTQLSASSPGGLINLSNAYGGTDIHVTDRREIAGTKFQVTLGINYDVLGEGRKGFQNFIGHTTGILGPLRRNEDDGVRSFDQYLQAQWEPNSQWLIEGGLRNSNVQVSSHDHYIVAGNGNDSGSVGYSATTPVFGVTYRLDPKINLYSSYGKGFQTPTLDELAYKSTNGSTTGLNFGLKASRSDNYEIGLKSVITDVVKVNLAAFHIDTTNELAIEANTAGRSVYQNVGRTNRDGVEFGLNAQWPDGFGAVATYTFLRATYANVFTSCPGLPCVPQKIAAGNRLPGVPLNSAYGELSWRNTASGFSTALEARSESKVFVNDPNSDAAPFYIAFNLRTSLEQQIGGVQFKEFVRLDNLTNRKYAGSVIVNESNSRFFEPAPGRAIYSGVSVHY